MFSKKIIIIAGLYLLIFLSQYLADENGVPQECIKEYKNKYTTIEKNSTVDEITEEYACFVMCVYKKWGNVDSDGDTKIERFKKYDINEFDLENMDLCAKKFASEAICLRVYKTQRCIDEYLKIDRK